MRRFLSRYRRGIGGDSQNESRRESLIGRIGSRCRLVASGAGAQADTQCGLSDRTFRRCNGEISPLPQLLRTRPDQCDQRSSSALEMCVCGAAADEYVTLLVVTGRNRSTGEAQRSTTSSTGVIIFSPPMVSFGACGRPHKFVCGTAADDFDQLH